MPMTTPLLAASDATLHDADHVDRRDEAVATMRAALNAATSLAAVRKALRMDRQGKSNPALHAIRQDVLNAFAPTGLSDLAWPLRRGAVSTVRLLLAAGANPSRVATGLDAAALDRDFPVIDPRDAPLFVAIQHSAHCGSSVTVARQHAPRTVAMVEALLHAGADVHARSHKRESLLHVLVRCEGLWFDGVANGLAQRLVQAGLDPASVVPHTGHTALHTLLGQRSPPLDLVVDLANAGVPVLAKDPYGRTALDMARADQKPGTGTPPNPALLDLLERLTEQAVLRDTFDATPMPLAARVVRARL